MTFCTNCGHPLEGAAFCTNCGQAVVAASQGYAGSVPPSVPTQGFPTARLQPNPPDASRPRVPVRAMTGPVSFEPVPPGSRPRRRLAAILVAAVVVAVVGVAGTVFLLQGTGSNSTAGPDDAVAATTAATDGSESPSSGKVSEVSPPGSDNEASTGSSSRESSSGSTAAAPPGIQVETITVAPATTASAKATPTTADPAGPIQSSRATRSTAVVRPTAVRSTAPSSTATSVATTGDVNPMAGPSTPISCGSGYIVQLASDTTEAGLRSRIPDILAAHHVPAGSSWTQIQGSCAIWSISSGTVLYAGPFLSPYDACDARLHGPVDAFIKVADAANFRNFYSCVCPATSASLPELTTLGQQSVWVGDLQRALMKLDHKISDLDGSGGGPVAWGIYSAGTAAAVREFQTDAYLPVTGTVDEETWDQLKAYVC